MGTTIMPLRCEGCGQPIDVWDTVYLCRFEIDPHYVIGHFFCLLELRDVMAQNKRYRGHVEWHALTYASNRKGQTT